MRDRPGECSSEKNCCYTHPDDHTIRTTDTPGFKPFTILRNAPHDAYFDVAMATVLLPVSFCCKSNAACLIL